MSGHKKYLREMVSCEFVRTLSISSESNHYRYGKFKDIKTIKLSCGHSFALASVNKRANGLYLCWDCKYTDEGQA